MFTLLSLELFIAANINQLSLYSLCLLRLACTIYSEHITLCFIFQILQLLVQIKHELYCIVLYLYCIVLYLYCIEAGKAKVGYDLQNDLSASYPGYIRPGSNVELHMCRI